MKNALVTAVLLALVSLTTSTASAHPGVDFFRLGVPKDRVPGVALVKLHGVDAHHLVVDDKPLTALGARTGVDLELIRPVALGWAFVEVRAHGVKQIPNETQTLALINQLA